MYYLDRPVLPEGGTIGDNTYSADFTSATSAAQGSLSSYADDDLVTTIHDDLLLNDTEDEETDEENKEEDFRHSTHIWLSTLDQETSDKGTDLLL